MFNDYDIMMGLSPFTFGAFFIGIGIFLVIGWVFRGK